MPINFKHEIADLQKGFSALELHEMHPLEVYRPTPQQLPIHESSASEVVVIGGKRAGKTLATVMEFGSRLLGMPIIREDGTRIAARYRRPSKKNPGLYWVIGLDVKHIGQTIYHRLFSDGLGCDFRIIPDAEVGRWRTYNPNTDRERYDESRLSPPLLGPTWLDPKTWHFESRAGNVFHSVRSRDGSVTLCAYATTGDHPKQGDAVYGIWLDEDTANAAFLKEWQDRLISVRGWFLWSVWPKVANEALIKTLARGERHQDDEKPPIQVFQLTGSENPYSDKVGIAEGLARMDDDDDQAHRDRGDISAFITGRRMYDFGSVIHIVKAADEGAKADNAHALICKLFRENKRLPPSWTRYISIDPSHTRTACLFGTVPPPEWEGVEMGNRLILEGELVVRKHTPAMLADALKPWMEGVQYEAFVMDQMIGRQTTVGNDQTVFQSYESQFRVRGFRSHITNSGFIRGCNDKALRRRTVRDMLEPIEGGWPCLLVSIYCPQTIKEFYNYRKKEVPDNEGNMVPMDDPVNERIFDCMAALEYLCQYVAERFRNGTAYATAAMRQSTGSMAYHTAMGLIAQQNKDAGGSYVHLGPGSAA